MLSYKESLKILKETNALLEGHFVLSSGLHSDKYVQCAQLLSKPNKAKEIYDQFVQIFKDSSLNVQTGKFGEIMNITLTNKGPITFNFRT